MTLAEKIDAHRRRLEALRRAEQTARDQLRAIRVERLRAEGALEALAQLQADERSAAPVNANGAGPNIDVRSPEPAA